MSDIDFPISSSIPPNSNSPPSSPPTHIQRIPTAGPTTTVDLPPQSPPSPQPQSNENENENETETPQPTQGKETTIPRPAFSTPFFTLIHDIGTESTIHPTRVHYIFSDDTDGHEVLSAACIRALEGYTSDGPSKHGLGIGGAELQSSSSSSATYKKGSGKEKEKEKEKGKEKEGRGSEERVLILDLDETGSNVVKASSLSANWQVLETEIGNAPTFDGSVDSDEENGGEGKGMMLRIDGVGAEGFGFGGLAAFGGGDEEDEGEEASEERMHALVERFEGRMKELRRVVEFGGLEGFEQGEGEEGDDDGGKEVDDVGEKRKKGSSEETAVRVD